MCLRVCMFPAERLVFFEILIIFMIVFKSFIYYLQEIEILFINMVLLGC